MTTLDNASNIPGMENAHAEYHAAMAADDAWQDALDAAKIERYSLAARGIEGSELRRLYEAKIAADDALHRSVAKPEYLQEECPNCGAYQVDYSGLCRVCLRQWTIEREELADGDFTRLY